MQIPTHWNLMGWSVITPPPLLSPTSILRLIALSFPQRKIWRFSAILLFRMFCLFKNCGKSERRNFEVGECLGTEGKQITVRTTTTAATTTKTGMKEKCEQTSLKSLIKGKIKLTQQLRQMK
jgi:hypothetical protein